MHTSESKDSLKVTDTLEKIKLLINKTKKTSGQNANNFITRWAGVLAAK